jgi:hypothetical protein
VRCLPSLRCPPPHAVPERGGHRPGSGRGEASATWTRTLRSTGAPPISRTTGGDRNRLLVGMTQMAAADPGLTGRRRHSRIARPTPLFAADGGATLVATRAACALRRVPAPLRTAYLIRKPTPGVASGRHRRARRPGFSPGLAWLFLASARARGISQFQKEHQSSAARRLLICASTTAMPVAPRGVHPFGRNLAAVSTFTQPKRLLGLGKGLGKDNCRSLRPDRRGCGAGRGHEAVFNVHPYDGTRAPLAPRGSGGGRTATGIWLSDLYQLPS